MIDWRIERCEDVRKSTRSMEYCWWKKSCTTWNVIIKISSINSIVLVPTFGGRSILLTISRLLSCLPFGNENRLLEGCGCASEID